MSGIVNCNINVEKITRDKYFKGQKGTYLNFTVAEKRETDQFGNTHSVYLYDKESKQKVYIGSGKAMKFDDSAPPLDDKVLPPGTPGIEDAHVIEDDDPNLPF